MVLVIGIFKPIQPKHGAEMEGAADPNGWWLVAIDLHQKSQQFCLCRHRTSDWDALYAEFVNQRQRALL